MKQPKVVNMNPFQIAEAVKNNTQLYGIQNSNNKKWVVDCFDEVRLFKSEEDALEYKKNGYLDYRDDDWAVQPWSYEESMYRDE